MTPGRVLVTGAGGFTGLALARSLVHRGHPVRGLVRSSSGVEELTASGVDVLAGDVRDAALVRRALEGVEIVYHLAAVFRRAGVPDSEYRTVHVDATRQLIEIAAESGVRRVVHCSTVGVHGDVQGDAPATEDAPFRPMDIYQQTKLEGEWMARETSAGRGSRSPWSVRAHLRARGPAAAQADRRGGASAVPAAGRRHAALPDGVCGRPDRGISTGRRERLKPWAEPTSSPAGRRRRCGSW